MGLTASANRVAGVGADETSSRVGDECQHGILRHERDAAVSETPQYCVVSRELRAYTADDVDMKHVWSHRRFTGFTERLWCDSTLVMLISIRFCLVVAGWRCGVGVRRFGARCGIVCVGLAIGLLGVLCRSRLDAAMARMSVALISPSYWDGVVRWHRGQSAAQNHSLCGPHFIQHAMTSL